jgi:hypothetical protein
MVDEARFECIMSCGIFSITWGNLLQSPFRGRLGPKSLRCYVVRTTHLKRRAEHGLATHL